MFSIIIPVFNGAGSLNAPFRSALDQSCRNQEILVVDDCSTNESTRIVERHMQTDSRIRFFRHETSHGGPFVARNTALDHASGDYLVFLDQATCSSRAAWKSWPL